MSDELNLTPELTLTPDAAAAAQAPAAPEAPGAIVRWEGGNDFTVWCDSQSGYICKITNSSVITDCNLDIHTFNVGGSYGNKQSQVPQVMSAAVLSMTPSPFSRTSWKEIVS